MAIGVVVGIIAFVFFSKAKKQLLDNPGQKRLKRKRTWSLLGVIIAAWFVSGRILTLIFGTMHEELEVAIFAPKMNFLGMNISTTIVITWGVMAVLIVLAVLFRLFVVPKFQDKPKGLQNVVEAAIELVEKFCKGQMSHASDALACYMFVVVCLLMGSAMVELFGLRPPTADLIMTFSLALVTFFLINYYGIKHKGFGGRIKSMAQPTPMIFPIKILTDIAVPVSLACRLFGNMLGGMIVMDLLKISLGVNGIGLPALAGLYFNVFHPMIQAYIFVTLSLTFINEVVE